MRRPSRPEVRAVRLFHCRGRHQAQAAIAADLLATTQDVVALVDSHSVEFGLQDEVAPPFRGGLAGGGGLLGGRKGVAAAPPFCARWRWPRILLEYQP